MRYTVDDLIMLNIAGIGYQGMKKLGSALPRKISEIKDKERLEKEWALIKEHKVSILSIFDDDYPESLKNIYSPPIVLYIKGKILPEDKTAIAFVGSRKASLYGLNICQALAGKLASLRLTIVSGLARGIDSAAHKGALMVGGRTLAVLGNGLGIFYPPENRGLAEEIAHSGALISEFPMEQPPLAQNFPIRNRIISGLSLGVVIVEAAQKSGALITANCALEQGREVFAVPGKAGSPTSMGTHGLIKKGAKLVDDVDDIIEELNLNLPLLANGAKTSLSARRSSDRPREMSPYERKIYDILSDEPVHIDSIIDESRLPTQDVIRLLLDLEIKSLVKELPGKNFIARK